MKNLLFFIILIALLFQSCQKDTGLSGEISSLEKEVNESPTVENMRKLISQYNTYVNDNPDDAEQNGRYLYRAAAKQIQINDLRSAIQSLSNGVKNYSSSSVTPKSLFLLGETYRTKFKQQNEAEIYYQCIAEGYPNHEYAEKAKSNIKSNNSLSQRINNLKQDIYMDTTRTRVNPSKAKKLVNLYALHASVLPDNPNSPQYLFDTYELANSVRMFRDAANACETLYQKYPDFKKAPDAMFLTGYLYENELKNLEKAKAIYESFLEKHPDNQFADSAKFALEHLGKPDDQLLKELQEKNKQNGGQ